MITNNQNTEPKKQAGFWTKIKDALGFIQNHFKAFMFLLIVYLLFFAYPTETTYNANLVRIDLSGIIMESESLVKSLESAGENQNIKGVLFVVDSGGGAVAPSVEISMAIKRLAEKKPVVAYAAGSMTSGSYYASAYANKIIANPASMIGSIGVIMQAPNLEDLAKKVGIQDRVIKAGEYKEAGTITREWTQKERESLQVIVDDIYDLFVSDIAKARNLDKTKAKEFADARVFIAHKAKQAGLIDEVGSINDAQNVLIKLANVIDPVWKQPDMMEQFSKRFASEVTKQVSSVFFGLKAY